MLIATARAMLFHPPPTALLLCLAVSSGCGGYYVRGGVGYGGYSASGYTGYAALQPPVLQARVAQLTSTDGVSIGLRLELDAYNPNAYDLVAREMDAVLSIAGQNVASARVTFGTVLPAQRAFPIVANVSISRQSLMPFLQGADGMYMSPGYPQLPFVVFGQVDIVGPGGQFLRVPVRVQGAVAREFFMGMMPNVVVPQPVYPMMGGPAGRY